MCGITGAAWTAGQPPLDIDILRRMTTALAHRGPDDNGYYRSTDSSNASGDLSAAQPPGAALGHRRLSIIDLGGGHQPLSNEDGTVWIAFNGEIYNYRELQTDLEKRGHQFRTSCDTEVIVHLYEEYGPDCVTHLRGMFAFAIWDDRKKQLLLARDRLGQKPLVYRHDPQRLLFGSELKSLLQVPGLPRDIDPVALNEYLTYQYVPAPRCMLAGFQKLPAGHLAIYNNGELNVRRYWKPGYDQGELHGAGLDFSKPENAPAQEIREQLRTVLTEAVRLRMRSDVPLGAFLSGGVDSTIIVGLMQQLSERPVQTFSIGFPVKAFDERAYAREAAEHLGTEHHDAIVTPDALKILPQLIWQYDEPFSDSSAIPTMYLSEMTRQNVTVSLSGDGGDELFAGYDRYKAVRIAEWFDGLPRPLQKMATLKLWQHFPASVRQKSRRRRLKRLLAALGEPRERRYLKWVSIFDDQRRAGLLTDDFRAAVGDADAAAPLLRAYEECPNRDFVTRTTCADVLTYLPGDILNKVDIASMTYGLECRSPFLDHHVAEFAASLPIQAKLRGRQGKRILLETFGDLLPESIQSRPKMGFGVPLDHWFRHELKPMLQETLLDGSALNRGYFRPAAVEQLVKEHLDGQWDHSYRLWSLLCLELWQRMFVDASTVPANAPATTV
ncbi:Asparagine synthetase [glutamine-hydrolyzing] 1 [Symmachiella dynata]|uniref:asparagine synthase (glutamine-hydrolyzing) n=1 Tax=Symmachiella dynata TaxID=2527995 RepID=UPI001188D349|nr:asparagine synthase (glutamine-hydrolyzing) [Symmachiella dynata]QDT48016.1 Asparagine synthetase [glutamine-hydrolyzing] 1 [Symmachiella dynata]